MTDNTFTDFEQAFDFLEAHPMFNDMFLEDLWYNVVKVNPETGAIDTDTSKNTKIEFWFEHGPYSDQSSDGIAWNRCTHDLDLDCGGDTYEEAMINLANKVKEYYSDDGVKIKYKGDI